MVSGGGSSQSSSNELGTLNPFFPVLNAFLTGAPTRVNQGGLSFANSGPGAFGGSTPTGGIQGRQQPGPTGGQQPTLPGIAGIGAGGGGQGLFRRGFGPRGGSGGSGGGGGGGISPPDQFNGVLTLDQIQSLGQLLEPTGTTAAQREVFGGGLEQQTLDLTQAGISNIQDNVIPGLTALASNDPSTFFDPAAASFMNSFRNSIIPQIQEQFGNDQFNTDIANQASFTGQQALLDIALGSTEQAATFATQASPVLAGLQQFINQGPTQAGQDVLGLSEAARQSIRLNSEGGTVLDTLLTLAGVPNTFGNVGESEGSAFNFGILS